MARRRCPPPSTRPAAGRGQKLCLGGKRRFRCNWELIPSWRREMTKRQAAGGTLCLLFGQAFPLVYCGADRSKVEGPIARALNLSHVERQQGKSVLAPSIKSERFPRPFLTHCPVQTWWHIHSQEMKVLHLCLAFR